MKDKNNFDNDIIKGEEIEYRLLSYLKKKYPKSYKMEGKFKDFDIEVPEKEIKIEVKRDIGSQKTDNFFIEYECNYNPSGIASSRANYWVIYDECRYIWIKISVLKTLAFMYGEKWEGTPVGGTTNVKAYLIPKKIIKEYSESAVKNG